jgi:hypothetical protein
MEILAGLLGAVLGALAGAITTYVTTRSTMRLQLEHEYDRTLRDIRLPHYQRLFHISRCIPRQWRPTEVPTRQDLRHFREDFHNWYFGENAGGMFLTQDAKDLYMELQNVLEEPTEESDTSGSSLESPLSSDELRVLRGRASDLRHQLTQDVGASQSPRLRWSRLGPTIPPPSESQASRPGRDLHRERPRR